jgi:light-regulated signal transduction histidine kinase (bacteriophytochrome)
MDDVRTQIAGAHEEEIGLLHERSVARRLAAQRLVAAILAGGLLSLALLLTAFIFLRIEIMRRVRVEEELRIHQEDLEILVAERTRELASANCQLKEEIAMRERAEEELRKTMEELARSNRELDQFASIAAHDLQSPLRSVAGFLELLARRYEGKLDEKADGYIARALNGTKRMSALIHDLYAYARAGTQGKAPAPVDLDAMLRGAIDNLRENINENGAVLTWDELPRVEGDDTQLVQLFQNLIANAIKFRKKDTPPSIRVSAEQRRDEWVFGVHDNGIGIEPRFYERVFVMFQRLHSYDAYPGTGLGLALCKRIVERHGGRIWIESRPAEGSSFYFTIPVRRAEADAREAGMAC